MGRVNGKSLENRKEDEFPKCWKTVGVDFLLKRQIDRRSPFYQSAAGEGRTPNLLIRSYTYTAVALCAMLCRHDHQKRP
jgi:hypothetical protein